MNAAFFNNCSFKFEISLISTKKGQELLLELPQSAIEYLEIEDTFVRFGRTGKCKLNNFNGVMHQLNVLDTDRANCIAIKIQNLDFVALGSDEFLTSINLFALLQNSVDTSSDSVDQSINCSFEDFITATTRTQSLKDYPNLTELHTPISHIQRLFEYSNKESISNDISSIVTAGEATATVKISELYDGNKVKSVFDMIDELYKYATYIQPARGPAIVSLSNSLESKVIIKPLLTYLRGFYEKYQNNEFDLSEYVEEEFVIGKGDENKILNTNFISSYHIITTDKEVTQAEKWINYNVSSGGVGDITSVSINLIEYSQIAKEFQEFYLANMSANLPSVNNLNVGEKVFMKKLVDDTNVLTDNYIRNMLLKSFVLDNKALTFTIPGNTHRQVGKFIRIHSTDAIAKAEKKAIDGYWFVILIKHIFSAGVYSNEYVCVRLHSTIDSSNIAGEELFNIRTTTSNAAILTQFNSPNVPDSEISPNSELYQSPLPTDYGTSPTNNEDGMVLPPKNVELPQTEILPFNKELNTGIVKINADPNLFRRSINQPAKITFLPLD